VLSIALVKNLNGYMYIVFVHFLAIRFLIMLLTKFRISARNLNIGTKVEDRICNLCKNNIEDEVHFLITSPLLEKFRI
jgi:hypothetical protein